MAPDFECEFASSLGWILAGASHQVGIVTGAGGLYVFADFLNSPAGQPGRT